MFKYFRNIAFLVVGLAITIFIAVWLLRHHLPRRDNSLRIDQTAIIIEEINRMAQLFTARYYDELALDTFKLQHKGNLNRILRNIASPNPFGGRPEDNYLRVELVVIARGTIMAGYDLSLLKPEDMTIENNSITFSLPPPQILEVIINPSDFEIFIEEGQWSLEEAVALKQKAARIMTDRAIERGIFEQSEKTAIGILQNLFFSLGFDSVNIKTTQDDAAEWPTPAPWLE